MGRDSVPLAAACHGASLSDGAGAAVGPSVDSDRFNEAECPHGRLVARHDFGGVDCKVNFDIQRWL